MPVETSLRPLTGYGVSGAARDGVTPSYGEHPSQELSAAASERMLALGQMSRGFVHDFRNVLAVISSALNLAKRNASDPAMLAGFLAGAQEGVERGLKMTTRLLDFASGHDCDIHAENVNGALRKLETLLRYAVGSDIRIVLRLDPEVPDFEFDPAQFNAAIMNLVVNARDAMPEGGTIQISTALLSQGPPPCQRAGAYVRVRVRDDGMGMGEEVRRKIFDPFFTTKAGGGTGLGVPQVDAFIKRAGGFMRIETAIGEGSTFDLFFPSGGVPSDQGRSAVPCALGLYPDPAGAVGVWRSGRGEAVGPR
jgi:signal transduction histidine kinase